MKNSNIYNNYTCDMCQNDFLFKYNESNVNVSFINCFEPNEILPNYNSCYYSCKTCEIEGNETYHNCIECKDDFKYEFNITNSNYKNCYINNPFDIETDSIIYYQDYSNKQLSDLVLNERIQTENDNETIQNIIDEIFNEFENNKIDSAMNPRIFNKNNIILLTSARNEENNITIDLCECENILKIEYNISKNDSLYILELIFEEQGMKIPKVEYEVYYPLNKSNILIKLNLTYCEGTKIEISIPVKINGTLDIYNPKSDYYNEICYKATSKSETDIILKDRRNEFIDNNMTLCEENCELMEYDYAKEKSKCSCDIKTNIPPIKEIKFNKNEFFKNFKDINNLINLNVMKCYKVVFKINCLKKNYGFFILSSIIIFYFISLLIFVTLSNTNLKKEINKIIWALKFNVIPIKNKKLKDKPVIVQKLKKKKKKRKIKTSDTNYKTNIDEKILKLTKITEHTKDAILEKS